MSVVSGILATLFLGVLAYSLAGCKKTENISENKVPAVQVNNVQTAGAKVEGTGDFDKARTLRNEGKNQEAVKLCEEIIAKEPKNTSALILLAELYQYEKNLDNALRTINKAVELENGNTWALRARGNIYADMKEYLKAEESYKSALTNKNNMDDYYIYIDMQKMYTAKGDKKKADEALKKAKDINNTK